MGVIVSKSSELVAVADLIESTKSSGDCYEKTKIVYNWM